MPSPTGLPIKGDRFRHVESGLVFIVVLRTSLSHTEYNIIAHSSDGLPVHFLHPPGYPEDHFIIPNFGWMLSRRLFIHEVTS